MKLYIAGKFSEKDLTRTYMEEVIKLGHTITHDWTSFEKEGDETERMRLSAEKDIQGVRDCDCMVALLTDPKYAYRGSFTEIGCGLGLNKKVIVVNPDDNAYCTTNCFYHHPDIIHVKSWGDVLDNLINKY